MTTQEIPRNEWGAFFNSFSRQHQDWLVTVEVFGSDIGAQVEAREMPLEGVIADTKQESAGEIAILVADGLKSHVTHSINEPTHVRLQQSDAGADEALEIESADGTTTLVRFRSSMPSEMVDGIV
ncbi:MAG TPA: DUF5335 family protein [Blastocatellia bacterium]|nr:DUF5335 family protein [Blastocatellia bacterium]